MWGCVPPPTQGSVHVCQGEPHLGVNLAVSGCFLNVPRTLLTGMVGPKEKKKKKKASQECADDFNPGGLPGGSRL